MTATGTNAAKGNPVVRLDPQSRYDSGLLGRDQLSGSVIEPVVGWAVALGTIPYDEYARYDVEFAMQTITRRPARLTPRP
jgi:hypothetical protein